MCIDAAPRKRNWRLYHLLDLCPPITARQVKWNFRKVTLRHHYYQAYLTLYNRHRKHIYDVTGEEGYGFLSSGTWGPFVPTLGATGAVALYCTVMLIEVIMLIIFFSLVGAQVDGVLSISWIRIVAPMMVFAIVMLFAAFAALLINMCSPHTYRECMSVIDRLSPIGNFIAAAAYFCIPFVIGAAVRHNPADHVGSYLKYMCLPIIGDVFYYATSLIWRWPRRVRMQMEVDQNEPSRRICYGIFFMAFANLGCGIAQWVMIGRKLDRKTSVSWFVVFIPFAVRAGVRIVEAVLRTLQRYTIGVRSTLHVVFDILGSIFTNGLLLTGLYLVAVRIERGPHELRMGNALIPVYITLAYMFLALIFTFIYLMLAVGHRQREERRCDALWAPPPEVPAENPPVTVLSTATAPPPAAVVPAGQPPKEVESSWKVLDSVTPSSVLFDGAEPHNVEHEYDEFSENDDDVAAYSAPSRSNQTQLQDMSSGARVGAPLSKTNTTTAATTTASATGSRTGRDNVRIVYASDEPVRSTDRSGSSAGVGAVYHDPYNPPTMIVHASAPQSATHSDTDDYTEETTYIDEEDGSAGRSSGREGDEAEGEYTGTGSDGGSEYTETSSGSYEETVESGGGSGDYSYTENESSYTYETGDEENTADSHTADTHTVTSSRSSPAFESQMRPSSQGRQ